MLDLPSLRIDEKDERPRVVATFGVPLAIRALQGLATAGFLAYAVWMLVDQSGENVNRDLWLFSGVVVLSAVLMLCKAITNEADRKAWLALAVGTLIWVSADVVYTAWISALDPIPYPSIADWMYLGFYPFAYLAIGVLLVRRKHRPPLKLWLDGLLVALGVAAYIWMAAPSIYNTNDSDPAAMFMSAANPVSDLVLLCLLVGMLSVMGWRADRMWWLLLASCSLLWITDTAWLLGIAANSYAVGAIIDIGWPLSFLLLGFAAWQRPGTLAFDQDTSLRAAAAPIVVTILSFVLLIFATQNELPVMPVALATAAIIVGACRTAQVFRQAKVQTEIHRQAHTDALTGLANRRTMDQRLIQALDAHAGRPEPCALLLLDVDSFKEINDTFGHAAGDSVLQHVGPLLTAQLRSSDLVARLGGDEFAILLGGTDVVGAIAVAERIRDHVSRPVDIAGVELRVRVSIGIAMCPEHAGNPEDLLRAADSAMYRAKRSQTGQEVYEAGYDVSERGRLVLIQELRSALSRGELLCEFQPKIELGTGRVAGAEALIRWRHPTDGLMYPASFLPIAEQAGLMADLNDRVLLIALAQAARWRSEDLPHKVSVNMTMDCLSDPALPHRIRDLLHRLGLPGDCLILEVTETALKTDEDAALAVLGALRAIGVTVSIDDYGTGYSSLAQLRRIRAQELKLDQTLVAGVATRADVRSIVHATVELAHNLGLRMVAEGVESADDLAELKALGCDFAQGYFICPPAPPAEITQWLRSHNEPAPPSLPVPHEETGALPTNVIQWRPRVAG